MQAHSANRLSLCTRVGMSEEAIAVLLSLAASAFTIVGGVGGSLYMGYLACLGVLLIIMVYFFNAFYPAAGGPTPHPWGFTYDASTPVVDKVCEIIQCAHTNSAFDNVDDSVLTFRSLKAFLAGICCFIRTCLFMIFTRDSRNCYSAS